MEGDMDAIDSGILRLLQKNARLSLSEISLKVNLSVPTVSERIKKIESSGLVEQYTAILNPGMMKKDLTAMMFVSLDRPQFSSKFLAFVELQDEVLECHYIAGDFDYLLKIMTENTSSLEKLLTKIKSVPGIQKTKTTVVLCTVKSKHSIVPDDNNLNEKRS
jgi:Lrp/AsnC family leucine-responsive transcriptional regulator